MREVRHLQSLEDVVGPSLPTIEMASKSYQLLVVERTQNLKLLWLSGLVLEDFQKDGWLLAAFLVRPKFTCTA